MCTSADPNSSEKSVVDEFMLSEYTTIASAHFQLHEGLRQSFRFYLGIVALPITAAAVILRDSTVAHPPISPSKWASLLQLPPFLVLILGVTAVVGIFMYLSMINTRFNIVLYTRTVNAARAYFSERAKGLGHDNFDRFLVLPKDKSIPRYREPYRADWWSLALVTVVDSGYALLAALNVLPICLAIVITILFAGTHVLAYEILAARRDREPIAGMKYESGESRKSS